MSTTFTALCGVRPLLRWMLALSLLATSHVALAAYCPTQSATVNQGGSFTFDVSNCDGPSNIGMGDDPRTPLTYDGNTGQSTGLTANGAVLLTGQSGSGTQTITYTHNGNSATSDTFYLRDEDENALTFNITIVPSLTAGISVSPASRNEDSGASFIYTVTLSQTSSSATTVNLSRSGTATGGTDYTGAPNSIVVPANATTATFSVTPVADTTVEADETVVLSVASGSGYAIGSPSSATATIVNDDVPTASITVAPSSVLEDGATNLIYTVTLDQPAPSAVSIAFSVGGSATSGADYAAVSSPLTIPAGQTSGNIIINPTADATIEPDETVVLNLASGTGYNVGSPNSATGTILNDDQPTLSINDVSVNEGNAGTTNATFTVSLSQPAGTGGVSFDIATADGTATAGVDYVASGLTGQTIPAGSSSATFTVLVNGDTLSEPNETFFVNVSNVPGASVGDGQGQGTIVNDDALPALSIDDVSVNEGNSGTTTATFTVSLSAASGQTVSVNYTTANGTATAGSDYVARSGTLTFAPGVTAQGVAITVNGDTAVEPNETFSVGLSGASNASIARATGTGTIVNDDRVVTVGPASLPAATAGSAYSQTLSASGGTAPYTFAITAGALPAGLSLSAAGVLSGTPTASGGFNFTATATDSGGSPTSGARAYTLTVAVATTTFPATSLPAGTAGQAYSSALNPATGGVAPYTYAVTAGALPAGITLNGSSGALTGTPGSVGSFSFSVTATDSTTGTPSQATRSYTLTIAAPPIVVAPSTLPAATRGTPYSQTLSASGGTAPYTYALASGTLPAGITLASNGTLSGTATVNGSFNFTVTANDAGGFSGSQAYVLTVGAPTVLVAPATLPNPTVGTAYSQTVTASGGTAPYTFAVTAGATPAGLSFSAAGVLSGTPTAAGTFNFIVTATDGNGFDGARAYTVTVGAPTLVLTPASQPAAHVDQAYSASFSTSGGTAPYHYTVTGSLPAGLSLADNGTLSGTPTQAGNFPVAIHVTDSSSGAGSPFAATVNLTLTVDADPLVLTPAGPALTATYGTSNSIAFASSGGSAPRALSLAGALPAGMSFDAASGVLSGTPTVTGSFAFTVTVTDASVSPATLSRNYTLTIAAVTVVVSPTTLPAATVGTAYSGTLGASGGVGPYTFAVSAGALPQGITLSASGALSGTPTQSGPATFTIRASDVNGMSGDQAYSVTVGEAAPVAVSDAAQTPANQAVIIPVTANDTGVITSVAVAASPTHGATVVEGTSVRYTPTADFFGTDVFTYTAIGPGGRSNAATVTVTVQAGAMPVAQDQSVTTLAGQTVRIDAASGASGGPFTALALATTPAVGTATVDGTTIIYAAPADASGTQRFTYTLSNAFGASQPATVSVTINPMPVAPPVSAAAVSGRNVRVNISAGASGGPFTGADVISVAPASAGQARVERSADGYAVVFDAAPAFVGLAQISYTLTNAYATSAPGVLSVSVAARPDPSKDPEVLGVLSAQADATRRMAVGQINNFQRRLEQLHNGQPAVGFSNGITLSSASANAATAMNERNRDHGPSAIQDLSATSSNMLADQNMVAPSGNTAGLLPGGASVWTGGVVNFGKAGSTRGDTSTDFTTSGVSMGADKLFADGLIIGAGVGYGRDDTDVGNDASRSKVDSYSAAVYASYRPTEAFFIDSLLGYQWLSLDSVRSVTDTGGRVVGNRDGKQWFGSLSMGYILRSRDIQLTPYGRFDAAQASLDGFTERGDDIYALSYQAQTVKTSTASAGVLAQFAVKRDYGVWAPQLRAEYGRDLEGSSSALISYADLVGSNPYRANLLHRSRDHALLGGGFSLQTLGGWNFTAEYQVQLESDTGNNQSVRFGIEKKFDH